MKFRILPSTLSPFPHSCQGHEELTNAVTAPNGSFRSRGINWVVMWFRRIPLAAQVAALAAAALLLQGSRSAPPPKPELDQTPQAVTATILRLEEQLDQAESQHRISAVDRLIADDYSGITIAGTLITKHDVLAEVGGKEQTSSESRDRQVRPLENAAVYTALVSDRGVDPKTQERYILTTRVTDVWQKRGREWKLVNDQATGVDLGRE